MNKSIMLLSLFLIVLCSHAYAGTLAADTVSYWSMDGEDFSTATNLDDLTGNYDVTTNNAQLNINVTGKLKEAFNFSVQDPATVPASFANIPGLFDGTSDFTVTGWIYATNIATGSTQGVMEFGADSIGGIQSASGESGIHGFIQIGGVNRITNYTNIQNGQWYHLIWEYDTSTGQKLYVNNILRNTHATTGTFNTASASNTIGSDRNGNNYWGGKVDEMAVFNRTLTSGERIQLYNNGTTTIAQQYPYPTAAISLNPIFPTNGQRLSAYNGSIIINATATINTCDINDSTWVKDGVRADNISFQFNATSLPVPDKVYSVFINCTAVSNATGDLTFGFTIDTNPPAFIANSTASTSRTIYLNVTANETVTMEYSGGLDCSNKTFNGSAAANTNFQLNATGLNVETEYFFNVSITDLAGNNNWSCFNVSTLVGGNITVNVFDELTNDPLNFTPVTVTLSKLNFSTQVVITNTSQANFTNLPVGTYAVSAEATDYPQRSTSVTITTTGFLQTANIFLLNTSNKVTFTVKDFDSGGLIENVSLDLFTLINGSFVTTDQVFTDFVGFAQFFLDEDTVYRIIFTHPIYFKRTITWKPTQASYTILLNTNVTTDFVTLFDDMVYSYSPTESILAQVANQSFKFTTSNTNGSIQWFSIESGFNGVDKTNVSGSPTGGQVEIFKSLTGFTGSSFSVQRCVKLTTAPTYCFNITHIINPIVPSNLTIVQIVNDTKAAFDISTVNSERTQLVISILIYLVAGFLAAALGASGLPGKIAGGIMVLTILGFSFIGGTDVFISLFITFIYFSSIVITRVGD